MLQLSLRITATSLFHALFLRFLGIYFVILGNFFKLTSVTDQVSEAGPAEPYDQ
jgi:hypothetical protein